MLSLMRTESSFDGEVQSHNLYAGSSAGSRESYLADLERGVDHDFDGAHHGRARPHFPVEEAFDSKHKGQATAQLAIETPWRFARLQRKYGRWGLAYIESLVRAADYFASANPGKPMNGQTKQEDQL